MKRIFYGLIAAALLASCGKGEKGVVASGTVEATEVIVSAKVSGEVVAVLAGKSKPIKKGDPILEIDPAVYAIKVKDAEAALEAANQMLLKAQRGLRPKEIQQARSQVNAARAQYELAENTLGRQKELFERNAISQQELEITESQQKVAGAQLNTARKQYEIARDGARKEDIEAASQTVERASAGVEMAKLELEYTHVNSPGDFTVSDVYVEPGELCARGQPVALLLDLANPYIDLFVPITHIAKVKVGDAVELKVDGFGAEVFKGTVEIVYPEAEFTPENITTVEGRSHLVFKVRVKVDDPQHKLKPGLPADARILVAGAP